MCGRFTLTAPRADVARFLAAELGPEDDACLGDALEPRWNIAPTQGVAAALEDGRGRRLARLHWGLLPPWAKDRTMAARMTNARSETVAEKPAFREALRQRRCLVPMSGFYEWQKDGRLRLPWHFRRPGGGLLAAAAIWERWRGEDGAELRSLALLTTAANALMAPVHHRMPVLLDEPGRALWMDPGASTGQLEPLYAPAPEPWLERWRVSRAVNRSSFEGPACVEPAPPESLFEDPPA